MRIMRDGWSVDPYVLVRTTGLPIELLEGLNCSRTVRMLDDVAEGIEDIEEAFTQEVAALLERLQVVSAQDDVREALFLSSPGAFAGLREFMPGGQMRSSVRKRVKHLMLYLQRLTTKCDTNSFFGPTWWGRIGQVRELLDCDFPAHFSIARRYVLWSHWAVKALARAISDDEEVMEILGVRPALGLALMSDGADEAWLADFTCTPPLVKGPIVLGAMEAEMLVECLEGVEQRKRVELVGDDVGRRVALETLMEKGLLESRIEVPSGLERPMDWLIEYVQSFPAEVRERWLAVLKRLEEGRQRYEAGDLDRRVQEMQGMAEIFEGACQSNAVRGEGAFYSDRGLVCEEAVRDWRRCDLGWPLIEWIEDELLSVLSVLLEIPSRRHRLRQAAVAAWFERAFPGEVEVPLPYMLAVADADEGLRQTLARVDEEVEGYGAALGSWLCRGNAADRHVEIGATEMRARANGVELSPCVVNLDLMIGAESVEAANRGDCYFVLSEAHTMQDLLVRNSSVVAHPDKEEASAASVQQYARMLPGMTVAEPVMEHTDKTKVMLPHGLLQIEFGGRALDPPGGGADVPVLRAGQLLVRRVGDRLCLTARGFDSIVLTRTPVWAPFNRTSVLNIFALPHSNRLGGQVFQYPAGCMHFPRISSGRLVLHRETWWMAPRPAWRAATGYSLTAWRELRRWRDQEAVPERVFVRFRDEPKPVFVDFRNPFLVNWFVRKTAAAGDAAQISEFLPGDSDLWVRDDAGHYCCEFRISMYLGGGVSDE